ANGHGHKYPVASLVLVESETLRESLPQGVAVVSGDFEMTSAAVATCSVASGDSEMAATDVAARSPRPGNWSEPAQRWLGRAEDLIALEMVNFLSECTIHLKNLAEYLAVCPILLMLAATSYPFQPQRFLVVAVWALLIGVAAGVIWVYVEMERNEVLSRIA